MNLKIAGNNFNGLAKLNNGADGQRQDEALFKACQEFESLFINEIFKSMRKTVPQGTLLPKSMAEDIFQGMMDEEISKEAAQKESFGLAEMLYQDLLRRK